MITGTNCIRLSNDSCFLNSRTVLNINTNNTYSNILPHTGNILEGITHNIDTNIQPVVTLVYNSRNGMLFMGKGVIISIKRLEDIGKLPYDWNGYGARPFSSALIDKCEKIVNELSHQPEIYPTGRQSIQFQYQLKDKSYLEFEIFADKTMCLWVPKRIYADAVETEIIDAEEKQIKEIVDSFYGSDSAEKRNLI